ncbi:reverse transcriptase domain-containing protein [Tanacetum coccineum]
MALERSGGYEDLDLGLENGESEMKNVSSKSRAAWAPAGRHTVLPGSRLSSRAAKRSPVESFCQLKGWWDNYLSVENQKETLNTVKTENGSTTPNAVYTLVVNIIEHFTERWSDNFENIRTLLNGLKCPTLTSFRWYKDTFLSRVMELPDSNSAHWKSKFIDGLPNLFAERVKNVLRKYEVTINYDKFTYGNLIGTCIQEGLALCNEIKLNQQIKKQNLNERKQLGQFCDQFGMKCSTSYDRKIYKPSKKRGHPEHKNNSNFKKREEKRIKRQQFKNDTKPICFKCGKIGHFANKCKSKKKINNLNLDEEIKDGLKKIILNSESETDYSSDYSLSEQEMDCNCLKEEDFTSEKDDSEMIPRGRGRASNIAESSSSSSTTIPTPNDPLYGDFMEFLKNKKGNTPSFAKVLAEEENEDPQEYYQSPYKEKIFILEYQDVMRYFEVGKDPWILMSRYLDNAPYVAYAYKPRPYYENILSFTGLIKVMHFTAPNSSIYNFSKSKKDNPTPYQQIIDKLKAQGKDDLSKEEILEEYLKEIKEDLIKNFEYQKSGSSMKTSSKDGYQYNYLAG